MKKLSGLAEAISVDTTEAPADEAPVETQPQSTRMLDVGLGGSASLQAPTMYPHTTKMIHPDDCVIWEAPDRNMEDLLPEDLEDLIASIRAEGRVERPLIARAKRIEGKTLYEITSGRRRFAAVKILHKQGKTNLLLPIEVRKKMSDTEAFLSSDAENRGRSDLCDLDRGRKYAYALEHLYDTQGALAIALGMSDSTVSRLIDMANMPDSVINAFERPSHIKELWIREIRQWTKNVDGAWTRLEEEAAKLAETQDQRRQSEQELIPNSEVRLRLKQAASGGSKKTKTKAKPKPELIKASDGKGLIKVQPMNGKKLPLEIQLRPEIGVEEILKHLETVLKAKLAAN